MPFVQEAAPAAELTPATPVAQATAEPAAAEPATAAPATAAPAPQTAPVASASPAALSDPTPAVPSSAAVTVSPEVASDPKATAATDAQAVKPDAELVVRPEAKTDSKPSLTITKSETVTTPLAPKAPSDTIWLFTWLPLVVMMGLWLYLRGRNQAAERARAEALLAASSKKSKKSARSQPTVEDASGATGQVASERAKGNSKRNKKDKQQQKKKQQQANSGASASNAKSVATAVSATASVAATTAANTGSLQPSSTAAAETTAAAITQGSTITNSPERKPAVPAAQPAKAIFEPLRKVTVSALKENVAAEVEGEDGEEQAFVPNRRRRPSPPPAVVTTPAKVSGGRFEKLNLPPANAGLSASSANRWPADAIRPATPATTPQPRTVALANATAPVDTDKSATPVPVTARGLGAFVKLAKPSGAEESPAAETSESQTESSST
jgi:hypothetical protein